MNRSCELCEGTARIHCESDHASLCWDCDAEVHSANFLVARHSRNFLCHVCQSPTPWSASGPKLGTTAAVCQQCAMGEICEVVEEVAPEEMENQGMLWSPPPSSESSSSIFTYEPSDDEHDSASSYFSAPPSYPAEA
ncbi:hypothetical protein CASFOL_010592 [Castilleja foliolosa]|uniref:B box-type domain-containing protein n=1 Tax=Castilleja foliolosa TaxID=1961234 RepID=A0ABD3DUZ1_9LAMI